MQGDLISRDFSVKALREYAEQKHAVGQTELANGILKAINFLEKEENVPTACDLEKIERKVENYLDKAIEYICQDIKERAIRESLVDLFLTVKNAIKDYIRNGGKEGE